MAADAAAEGLHDYSVQNVVEAMKAGVAAQAAIALHEAVCAQRWRFNSRLLLVVALIQAAQFFGLTPKEMFMAALHGVAG